MMSYLNNASLSYLNYVKNDVKLAAQWKKRIARGAQHR
jgi:hypothetical protein